MKKNLPGRKNRITAFEMLCYRKMLENRWIEKQEIEILNRIIILCIKNVKPNFP